MSTNDAESIPDGIPMGTSPAALFSERVGARWLAGSYQASMRGPALLSVVPRLGAAPADVPKTHRVHKGAQRGGTGAEPQTGEKSRVAKILQEDIP